jgi:sugar lactone lactonase YvrE
MFLEFPGSGGRPTPLRSLTASIRSLDLPGTVRLLLLPVLLLAVGTACSHHTNHASDPGTPPSITAAPVNATTVTGRPVTFSVTAAGAPTLRFQWSKDGTDILGALGTTYTLYNPQPQDSGQYTVTITNPDGTLKSPAATLTVVPAVTFTAPTGIVADASGNLFVSDMEDQTIWKVDATNHKTLLAGSPGLAGSADGQGSGARFNAPGGLALDPAGNLVVADAGNHTIRRIAPDGTVTTLAGTAGLPGSADGVGAQARFNGPFGVAVDGTGKVYIADALNHTIRLMATDGTVTTYAGAAGLPGLVDGAATTARFNQPNGLALAADGTLYVADYGNSSVRAIAPGGVVSRLAGQLNARGFADGAGTSALFNLPVGIALDAAGNLWIADTHNHAVRKLTPQGAVSTPAGAGGTLGNADGAGSAGLFNLPCGIAVTPAGNLVVADTDNHLLRSVTPAGTVGTYTTP